MFNFKCIGDRCHVNRNLVLFYDCSCSTMYVVDQVVVRLDQLMWSLVAVLVPAVVVVIHRD